MPYDEKKITLADIAAWMHGSFGKPPKPPADPDEFRKYVDFQQYNRFVYYTYLIWSIFLFVFFIIKFELWLTKDVMIALVSSSVDFAALVVAIIGIASIINSNTRWFRLALLVVIVFFITAALNGYWALLTCHDSCWGQAYTVRVVVILIAAIYGLSFAIYKKGVVANHLELFASAGRIMPFTVLLLVFADPLIIPAVVFLGGIIAILVLLFMSLRNVILNL